MVPIEKVFFFFNLMDMFFSFMIANEANVYRNEEGENKRLY